jgi:hypothetical protein
MPSTIRWSLPRLAVIVVALAAVGCSGSGSVIGSAGTPATSSTSAAPTTAGSGATACIDAETAAVIQSIRDTPANAQSIITEKRDVLIAGLQRFIPPPDATTWRDDLVTAIQNGDAAAAQAKVQAIGSEVKIAFC